MEKNQNRRCWAFQGHYYRWMASSSGEVVASVMVPRPTSASACVVRAPCVNRVSASMAGHWKHRWNYGDYCELDFGSVSLCSIHTGSFFFFKLLCVVRIYLFNRNWSNWHLIFFFSFFIWAESLGPKTIACQSFGSVSLENCLKVGWESTWHVGCLGKTQWQQHNIMVDHIDRGIPLSARRQAGKCLLSRTSSKPTAVS